jgi:DNA-binding transcriptional LysR family regulator
MRGTQFAELSAFVAVAEQRSFTKAARQLGVSRPSISGMVRSLEERLGVRLLNRTTRSVALTEAGQRLLADAEPILDAIDKAIDHVNAHRGKPRGTLRLNMHRAVATLVVEPLLTQFLTKYPDVKMEIFADETNSDIVTGRFDAGIRRGDRIAKDMIAVRVLDGQRVAVVASPAYLTGHRPPTMPQDLLDHNCVRLRSGDCDGSIMQWNFEKDGRKFAAAVDGSLVVNDWFLLLNAVLDGLGVGYFPEVIVSSHVANGRLVRLMEDWCGHFPGIFLFYPSRRQMPSPLRAFVDFMRQHNTGSEPAAVAHTYPSSSDLTAPTLAKSVPAPRPASDKKQRCCLASS